MTVSAGPYIATSGLVFNYDMNNTARSWKGQPATNLIPYSQDYASNGNFLSNWTGNLFNNWINSTITTGYTAPDGSPTANLMTGYYSRWTASISASTSTTYTFSVWLKNNTLVNDPYLHVAFGLNGSLVNYNNVTIVPRDSLNDWTRFSVTVTSPSSGINQIQCGIEFGASKANSSGPYSMLVWGAQCEVGSYASPYIPSLGTSSSRSNTQSLIDVSGSQNIITANNLTYNSNNTFSFNGSSNYMTVAGSSNWAFGQNGTVEQWVNLAGNNGINNRFYDVTNNSTALDAYLNGSTYNVYFHGGSVGTTSVIPNSQWVHMAVTYTSGTIAVYFNGVAQGLTGTTTGYNMTNAGTLFIGEFSGASGYFINGRIPIMRVYNRGLTAAEVLQNFNAQRSIYGV